MNISRRKLLENLGALGVLTLFPQVSLAKGITLPFNDERGAKLLSQSLNSSNYWKETDVSRYDGLPYDEIRLKSQDEGYVIYISGNGRHAFTPEIVAEGIFQHQDLIPKYMPALKVARYIGRGIDKKTGLEYTDIYFLVDIKLFFMSVPLRTTKVALGDGRYVCTIELVTEDMVSEETWKEYSDIIREERERLTQRWAFQEIVPTEYVYGYYLIEPEEAFGVQVTMTTRMKFKENVNFFADIGSEVPFVLRQGMSAGFVGSVEACKAYMKTLDEHLEAQPKKEGKE